MLFARPRQLNGEAGAAGRDVVGSDGAGVLRDDGVNNGKAKPRARRFGSEKWFEDVIHCVGRYTLTAVFNRQKHVPVGKAALQFHPAASTGGVQCVQREIHHHLAQPPFVPGDDRIRRTEAIQPDSAAVGIVGKQSAHFFQHCSKLNGLGSEVSGSRKLHEIFENVVQAADFVAHKHQRIEERLLEIRREALDSAL
jgi:hypothetical protein